MIGMNELRLNEATMIQAVQEWLDRKMPHGAPKVRNVKTDKSGYDEVFIVTLVQEVAEPIPVQAP